MFHSFEVASRPQRQADGRFALRFTDDWLQGPGVFGGLIFAAAVRALAEVVDSERSLRSFQGEILAPVKADTETIVHGDLLRAGRSVTYASARFEQEEVRALFTAAYGNARSEDVDFVSAQAPAVPAVGESTVLPAVEGMPTFAHQVEYRPVLGSPPVSGSRRAYTGGWVRFRNPGDTPRDALALALVDTWWPAAYVTLEAPRHLSTMAFNAFLFDLDFDPEEPVIKDSETVVMRDGYADQSDRLFTPDGRLIATSRQLVALVR